MRKLIAAFLLLLLILSSCVTPGISPETTDEKTDTRTETETFVTTSGAVTDEKTTEEQTDTTQSPPEKTAAPTVKGYLLTEPGIAMIYGSCTDNSEIILKSDIEEFTAHSDGGYFAVSKRPHTMELQQPGNRDD